MLKCRWFRDQYVQVTPETRGTFSPTHYSCHAENMLKKKTLLEELISYGALLSWLISCINKSFSQPGIDGVISTENYYINAGVACHRVFDKASCCHLLAMESSRNRLVKRGRFTLGWQRTIETPVTIKRHFVISFLETHWLVTISLLETHWLVAISFLETHWLVAISLLEAH